MTASKEMHAFLRKARTWDEPPEEKGAALRELVDRRIADAATSSTTAARPSGRLFALRFAAPIGLACLALLAGASRGILRAPASVVGGERGETATIPELASQAARQIEEPTPDVPSQTTRPSDGPIDVRDLPDAPKVTRTGIVLKGPAPLDTSLEIETRILREARAARLAGAPDRSLSLASEHAARFPNGALAPERDAERISALCALGRVAEARERIAEFELRGGSSALLGRVRASCRGAP